MNCLLSFHRSAGVPSCTPGEVPKATSEPPLRHYVATRSAEQHTNFFTHARARAAFLSAQRYMSPTVLNRATPQVGSSTILRPRFIYRAAGGVGGSCQQELQRQESLIQHSCEHHLAPQNPQPSQPQQEHQHCREESSQKELAKKCGLEHHTTCKLVNATDHKYTEQEQRGACLTASEARRQHAQQLLSPAANGQFAPCIQQQLQLKGDIARSHATEDRAFHAHQTNQRASRWKNIFVSAHGATASAAGPCTTNPNNQTLHDNTFLFFSEQHGIPSFCRPKVPPLVTSGTSVRAGPSQARSFSVFSRGSSTGDGVTGRDERIVLHLSKSDAVRVDRDGGPRPPVSFSVRGDSELSISSTSEAAVPSPAAAAAGVEQAIPAAGGTTPMGTPLEGMTATAGGTAREKVQSTSADTVAGRLGNTLSRKSRWSSAPRQQAGGSALHFWARGSGGFTTGNNRATAAQEAVQRGGGDSAHQRSHGLHCRLQVDVSVPKPYTATAGPPLHTAAPRFARDDVERKSAEEEMKYLVHTCSAELPRAGRKSPDAVQHELPSSKLRSSVCDPAGKSKKPDSIGMYAVAHSRIAEKSLSTSAQHDVGFALGRPRTPTRVRVPETHQRWQSPSYQRPPQAHEHAQQYSNMQKQINLQQQLRQLHDQYPYSWAGVAMPVGHGSPMVVPGSAPKLPFIAGRIQSEKRPQTSILANALVACCWQPHSPRDNQVGPTLPSTCSNGSSVAGNQVNWMLSPDGATCIQTQGQQQRLQKNSTSVLHRRPTSAPPGKNDLRLPPPWTVAQPDQQRAVASTGAVIESRRGVPWRYQSHQVLEQCSDHRDIATPSVLQPSPLTAAARHLTSGPPFTLGPSEALPTAPAPATGLPLTGKVTGSSVSNLEVTGSNFFEKGPPGPAQKGPQQVASSEARPDGVFGQTTAGRYKPACTAEASSTNAPFLAPAEAASAPIAAASAGRSTTGTVQEKAVPRFLGTNTSLSLADIQCSGAGKGVLPDSKLCFTWGKQLHSSGSATHFPTCHAAEQKEVFNLPTAQNDVGVAPGGGSVYESETLQQRQQPYGITTSQADLPTLSTDATSNVENSPDGKSYEAKAARVEAPISVGSAGCTSATQPQDHVRVHQKRPTQRQDSSDSVRQHVVQDEQRQGEQNQKHSQPQRRQEQQSQPWRLQCDLLRTVRVPAVIDERPSRTGILQQKESADGLQKHHIDLHKRTQPASVVCGEALSHRERSISTTVERHSKMSFAKPSAPSSLNRPGPPTSEEEKITDNALQTSLGEACSSLSHSTTQNPLANALQCGDSVWTSDRVFVNANVTPEPSGSVHIFLNRAEVSISSVTGDSVAAEVADIEPSKQCTHEQQAALVHPKANADNGNVTGDPTVHNAEMDARTNQSTVGSEGSGMDGGRRDVPERCSQEGTLSGTSSCRHTSSSSSSSTRMSYPFRVHDFSYMPEAKVDDNGDTRVSEKGAPASSQSTSSGSCPGSSCDTAHAGSQNIGRRSACAATAKDVEGPGDWNDIETQIRARSSSGSSQREFRHLERKVERDRIWSLSSTDVSRCTGRSTTNSNENLNLSEEGASDVNNEGQEDVIPLPSFLWRSPLSLLRDDADGHNLRSGAARTAAEVESTNRPGCCHSSSQCGGPFQNGETHTGAEKTDNNNDSYLIQGDIPCATNVPNTATMQLGDFELADPRFGGEASLLGRGTYGVVRLMRHKPTGRFYAVKSIEKSSVVEAGMVSQVEFELLTQKDVLRHRNVLRCHAFLEDVDRVHMILEYCSGGDLYTRIRTQPLRRISEQEAFLYFAQLVNGLHYMHTRCIMHRDLKLENLLLDKDGVLKIADLGWCTTILGKRRNFNFCGTLDYLAPEMIRGDGHDWRVDLWGAGILLYEMLDGKPPFQSTRHLELVQQILKAKINMPPHIPPDAGNLIEQLLQYDPEDRIPLHAICQHPWVKRMWGELKRHYYSVYPNAIPAAFDLCAPASTARMQVEDALSLTSGKRKMLLDLREIYPLQVSGTTARADDGHGRSGKAAKSPHSTDVSSPSAAAAGTLHGVAVAPSTAAGRVDADSVDSDLATTAGVAAATTCPCDRVAGAKVSEADCGSVVSTAQHTVAHLSTDESATMLEIGRPEKKGLGSCMSKAQSNSGLRRQHRRRVSAHISARNQKQDNHDGVSRREQGSEARVAAENGCVVESKKMDERASGGAPSAGEQEQEKIVNRDTGRCTTAAKVVCDRQTAFASCGGSGETKSRTKVATDTAARSATTSPDGAITASPAAVSTVEHSGTPSSTVVQPSPSHAKAATPPAPPADVLTRLKTGSPPATRTTAAQRRRTTATATIIREAVEAAASRALTSRAADTSPKNTSVGPERGLLSENSLPCMQIKAKRFGAGRRPKVVHPISKIDSGLGSQKQILLSPPMKRSALRAREPWDGSTPSVGETEQKEMDVTESPWAPADEPGKKGVSVCTKGDFQRPPVYGGLQEPTTSNLPQQHLDHMQTSVQQEQQLRHRHQQVLPGLESLEQNLRLEQEDTRQGQELRQLLAPDEERLRGTRQSEHQSELHNQWNVEQQPLLQRVYGSEHHSATLHPSPPSPVLPQQHPSAGLDCSPTNPSLASAASEPLHHSVMLYHHQCQHLQRKEWAQRTQAFSEQQTLSPRRSHQLQPLPTQSALPKNGTDYQQPLHPWTGWCLRAQQPHTREQPWLSSAQKHVGGEQQALRNHLAPQAISPHCHFSDYQQHILQQQPQALSQTQHIQQKQPFHEQPCGELHVPGQTPVEYHQHHLQRHHVYQNNCPNSKEVAGNAACQPMQQQGPATVLHQTGPHQLPRGQHHYALGYKQQRMRSMTPPASFELHRLRNPANSLHLRSYHHLPHQHSLPWHLQASACTPAQLTHSTNRTVSFYSATGAGEQPQRNEVSSSSCTIDNSAAQTARRETRATSVSNAVGTASTGVAAAETLQPFDTSGATSEEHDQISYTNLGACSADVPYGEVKGHSECASCSGVAHPAGDCAFGNRAEIATRRPAAISAGTNTLTTQQGMGPEQAYMDQNAFHAYTPRWGRSRHAAADRSVTVAPPSLLSPLASASRIRRLLAISAPPRSCATAAAGRKHPHGVPTPGNSEQHRQHRQQVQQLRQQGRPGASLSPQQQQQRGLHQRAAAALVPSTLSHQVTQQGKKDDCLPMGTLDLDDIAGTERLSCFSFGSRRGMNRHSQGESTSNSDLTLLSDRHSLESVHCVGVFSQRNNVPDTSRGGPAPLFPSAKARLVLNKLFENSTPPRSTKTTGARIVARTPAPRARPVRAAAVAGRASAVTSIIGSRPDADPTVPAVGSTIGMPPKALSPSPKAACRFRQIGSRSRFHTQSPPSCRTAAAAVAAATAAWRARAPQRESRERKASAETIFRVGRMIGNCTRQGASNPDNAGQRSQDSVARKTGFTHAQGRFDVLGRSRAETHGFDAARKIQRLSDLSLQKRTCAAPPRGPQTHAAAGRQRQGAEDRVVAKGTHKEGKNTGPRCVPATSSLSLKTTKELAERSKEVHAIWSNNETQSNNTGDGNNCCIVSCISSRAAMRDTTLDSEESGGQRNVSPPVRLQTPVHLQQQGDPLPVASPGTSCSQSADTYVEQLTSRSIVNKGLQSYSLNVEETYKLDRETEFDAASTYGEQNVTAGPSHEQSAQGTPSFPASMPSANNFMSDHPTSPPTAASPAKCLDLSSAFPNGRTSNTSPWLSGYQYAAAATVAAAAAAQQGQRSFDGTFVCQRYWSPPCCDANTTPWASCSTSSSSSSSERVFLSREPMPQSVGNFANYLYVPHVARNITHKCPPAGLQQVDNPPTPGGAGGSPLTSSWLARERQLYTTRQQTPPPAVASVAIRGMRQAAPLCSATLGSQQRSAYLGAARGSFCR